jgi:hypothetical protein
VRGTITSTTVRAGGIVDVADAASNASARTVLAVTGPAHRPDAPKARPAPAASASRPPAPRAAARTAPNAARPNANAAPNEEAADDPRARAGVGRGPLPPRIFQDNQIAKLRERIAERELLHDIDDAIVRARKEADATLRTPGFMKRVVVNTSLGASAIVKIGESELAIDAPLGPSLLTRERDAVVAAPLEE